MSRENRAPRWVRRAVRRTTTDALQDEVIRDLDEIWRERAASEGRWAADRWAGGQAFRALYHYARGGQAKAGTGEEEMMESLRRDIGFALKQLRSQPGVGVTAIVTLALGIGATTATFSVVHGVLLKPLPFEEPDDLVMVTTTTGGSELPRFVSGPDFVDMASSSETIADLAGFVETTVGPMTQVDRPEHIVTTPVTWNLFDLLGVDVAMGRRFTATDAVPASQSATTRPPMAAIISHEFWLRSFGADPDVIGTTVRVWGGSTEIVGVLPEGFQLVVPPELNVPPDGDIWRAMRTDLSEWSREARAVRTIGRLRDGASVEHAREELARFSSDRRRLHPHHDAESTDFVTVGLVESAAEPLRGTLWILLGAVGLVLMIACANVANLLLARGAVRRSEMAVRASLGAGRTRLLRQLLTESGVIALLGAAGGIALAHLGVTLLHRIRPADLQRLEAVQLDTPVLAFAVFLAVTSTVLAGLLPAVQLSRAGLVDQVRTRGEVSTDRRSRDVLVIGEVALSVVLLVGAGLLIRSFSELQRMPLGFEPESVLTVTATQSSRPRDERQAYEAELIDAVERVPGVTSAGIVFPLPMNGVYDRSAEYTLDDRFADPAGWTTAYFRTVSPNYFETMGIELLRGRDFTPLDETYDVPIVVLDERLARQEFDGRDPVGEALWVRGMEGDTLRATVVGVVEYAPQWDHRDLRPTMYFPRVFYQSHEVSVVARFAGEPESFAAAFSDAIREVDPAFPSDLVPMQQFVQDRLARTRFLLILMQLFGLLALGLSAVGLYGVLSYSVRQRVRELGLRRALGAEGPTLTARVLVDGLRLAAIGVGIGLFGGLILGRTLRTQLFRVGASDPTTLIGACVVVLVVAGFASLLPAARAARVDPAVALQEG
ncbi:MAG: ABC transporter permease [Gemmatimonadota bacterium]